jgi:uncharacterized membrane protein SpoIIM required for sporulation
LAQTTTRNSRSSLSEYLNELSAAAHSLIYLPPRESMWRGAVRFFIEGFARAVARTWRYHATAALLLFGGAFLAYWECRRDPAATYCLSSACCETRLPGSTAQQLEEALRSGREHGGGMKFFFASYLFQNNLKVGVLAMGLGALAGIPTVLLLVYNGMILGGFTALYLRAGITTEFWAWILPHGVTEILAIILCGGVGLALGAAIVRPGLLTRAESLRRAGLEAGRVVAGAGGMLVFAAIIESYLRQSHLPSTSRLLFAGGSALFWIGYFAAGAVAERQAVTAGSENAILRTDESAGL